ncbi:MAG: hypothetical protein KDJ41_03605 [Hyphomicrobiaceae bacterium]|nr:hypothetical protein [Hyphomicrobiaceae bacterium]
MDMDDDFMGEIEFDLTADQQALVARAISVAATKRDEEDFTALNPLIAIMQWWQLYGTRSDTAGGTPEARLTEACRQYIAAHSA